MKLFITVQQGSDPRSGGFNLFDYKVMFFLKEGFKLLHSNHNMRESYGELYA
ncbi:hypothetical protein LCGC14_1980470, partial [marine sediment metagenome]